MWNLYWTGVRLPSPPLRKIMETKKILAIGGTQMIGRDFVEYCLQNLKEYEIYIANRNITNPNLFNCKHIKIDRDGKESCESLLDFESFDVVVDFSCYNSRQLYNVLSNLHYKKFLSQIFKIE